MQEEREYQKFLDENTRKVLVEKVKKPKEVDYDYMTVQYSMDAVMNADFVIGFRRKYLFNGEQSFEVK